MMRPGSVIAVEIDEALRAAEAGDRRPPSSEEQILAAFHREHYWRVHVDVIRVAMDGAVERRFEPPLARPVRRVA
jgi:hypothetical protein